MRYQLQNALLHIRNASAINLLSLLGIAFFTVILNAFLLNHSFVYQELEFHSTVPPLVAFLSDTVTESKGTVFANQIQKENRIVAVYYVSKDESLTRAQTQFGKLSRLIKDEFSSGNPFPASLEIYVDSDELKTLEEIAINLEAYNQIEDVSLTEHGKLATLMRQTNRVTIASSTIVILLLFFTIYAVVLKTARTRQEEIQLMHLIGAARGYIITPFLIQGIFLGCIGTLIGIGCFYILFYIFNDQIGAMDFLPAYQLILIVIAGSLIGSLASLFSRQKI